MSENVTHIDFAEPTSELEERALLATLFWGAQEIMVKKYPLSEFGEGEKWSAWPLEHLPGQQDRVHGRISGPSLVFTHYQLPEEEFVLNSGESLRLEFGEMVLQFKMIDGKQAQKKTTIWQSLFSFFKVA